MQLKKINLPYSINTALDYFSAMVNQPWAMLLHSGNANHHYNRFDIIVADPITTLETRYNITKINSQGKIIKLTLDPFDILKNEIQHLNIMIVSDPDLPFQGGALGLWSYDLVRRIEALPEISKTELNFPDMAIGIYLWALIVDHHKKIVTLLSYQNIEKRLFWLKNQVKISTKEFQICEKWQSNMSKLEYYDKFNKIHQYLRNGDCYQINLAQRFKAKYKGDEWNAFIKLNQNNQAPFSAFIRLENNCIISLSPERFLSLHDNLIQTRPIKGSLPRLSNTREDKKQIKRLQLSIKNRAENIMIVDLLRNDIGKVAIPGTVSVPELFVVESFPAIHHLVSTIIARLHYHYKATDLLKACFPGGSITGAPKIRSMEIIEELEPNRRYIYSGSIGYISLCGTMDTNICIRTLLTEDQYLYCWSGGGIVIDSLSDDEYQETFDKLSKILSISKYN
ncbi:Aminodeoxychorismate synthase component 1 [Candidatus Arsenophonus lipoptenae]|uniref:aminodeoxychorismate synthase n=1 Tax=Candidatus Arsenophonus lipoptenae TaxID=634113 RepID=A0A109Q9S6_9GAMM|nr:aminodeoxychorismate synthase component 1 [Candidatus Arsenophonus lipoptenae]AMA65086.1 Aminodeoxychorismate synthase component 1 [Candidatus Arsenophonus lipoptenae]